MTRSTAKPTSAERLAQHLFDGVGDPGLAGEIEAWLVASPRFRSFADANRDKIRKKLRTAGDDAARGDVRAELEVARELLEERRIELAFEPRGSVGGGPDFAVTYRDHHAFDLEVTRPRRELDEHAVGGTLLVKLRQLPPGVPNAVLIVGRAAEGSPADIGAAVRTIRARADAKDEGYFTRRAFEGTRQFYDRFLRLGAVVVWNGSGAGRAATAWRNPSARIPVPERALAAAVSRLEGSGS